MPTHLDHVVHPADVLEQPVGTEPTQVAGANEVPPVVADPEDACASPPVGSSSTPTVSVQATISPTSPVGEGAVFAVLNSDRYSFESGSRPANVPSRPASVGEATMSEMPPASVDRRARCTKAWDPTWGHRPATSSQVAASP